VGHFLRHGLALGFDTQSCPKRPNNKSRSGLDGVTDWISAVGKSVIGFSNDSVVVALDGPGFKCEFFFG